VLNSSKVKRQQLVNRTTGDLLKLKMNFNNLTYTFVVAFLTFAGARPTDYGSSSATGATPSTSAVGAARGR